MGGTDDVGKVVSDHTRDSFKPFRGAARRPPTSSRPSDRSRSPGQHMLASILQFVCNSRRPERGDRIKAMLAGDERRGNLLWVGTRSMILVRDVLVQLFDLYIVTIEARKHKTKQYKLLTQN